MACAGVVASAGAQIDFFYMRAQAHTDGKASKVGHTDTVSAGNVSGGAGLSKDLTNFSNELNLVFGDGLVREIPEVYSIGVTALSIERETGDANAFDTSPDADLEAKCMGSIFVHNLTDGTSAVGDMVDDSNASGASSLNFLNSSNGGSLPPLIDDKTYAIEFRRERV